MCLLEGPFIALPHEKAQWQMVSEDEDAFGHMENEETSKSFCDNPLPPLTGDFAHFLGNTFSPLTSVLFPNLSVRIYFW